VGTDGRENADIKELNENIDNIENDFISSEEQVEANQKDRFQMTQEWEWVDGERVKVPILQSFALPGVVRRIGNHNANGRYTGVMLLGQSGSGKSTLTAKIIELLEKQGRNYHTLWLSGLKDFQNLDKTIAKLPKGVPTILVFTDMTAVTDMMKKEDISRLEYALTTVRHTTQSKIICMFQIHYSKAMQKFFRNQHFTFLTSLGSEEQQNISELFGKHNDRKVKMFGSKIRTQMVDGYISFPAPGSNSYKWLNYTTNKPYRIALVDELGWVHYCLYSRAEKDLEFGKGKFLDAKDMVDAVEHSYGLQYAGTVLRFMAMINDEKGDKHLSPNHRAPWRLARKIAYKSDIDWNKVLGEVERRMARKHKKFKWRSKTEDEAMAKIDSIVASKGHKVDYRDLNSEEHDQDYLGPPA
jgi:energy-coupling factor transporter ATP-binding protein EcfA2